MPPGVPGKTYDVLHKRETKTGRVQTEPGSVFKLVQVKLMRFLKTPMEKQMRISQMFENLQKGKKTALQLEPVWEESLADLDSVGLGKKIRSRC